MSTCSAAGRQPGEEGDDVARARRPAGRACATNITTDQTNASPIRPVAIQPAIGSPMRLPKSSRTHRAEQRERGDDPDEVEEVARAHEVRPSLQQIEVVGGGAATAAEDGDDDAEADRDLGRGDRPA